MSRAPVSIVILAWNAWSSTRACLDSLRPTLGVRDEVIVVDNGSADETPTALKRYPWVRVVSNAENRGFAGGCNDGAAAATQSILIFLNNDTLLTGRWIEPLVSALEDERIGAAGPRSNFVSGPQIIEKATYSTTTEMRRFSREWCRIHRGEVTDASRLVGFCLAIRAQLLTSVGGFDESYGIGGYEDDDLCRRVLAAGKRLVICDDSFVHHEGHKTFDVNGLDWYAEQEKNRERFQSTHSTSATTRLRISACLITKDEESNLPTCLASIADLVDETVIYDTGSTDSTVEIARAAGATVIEGYWDDDFSRARNAALEHCTGDWIVWLDADETLQGVTRDSLRADLASVHADVDALSVAIHNEMGSGVGSSFIHRATRMFRRSRCEWNGRIHEQIVRRQTSSVRQIDYESGYIHHTGYLDAAMTARNKRERNLHLARVEVETSSGWGRAHSLTSLARSCIMAGHYEEAYARAMEALDNDPNDVVRRMALRAAIEGAVGMDNLDEAVDLCERLRHHSDSPMHADMLEARIRMARHEWAAALELLEGTNPDEADADGLAYTAGSLAIQRAEALTKLGRFGEAADALIAVLFHEGVLDAHIGTVVDLLDKARRPLDALASAIPESRATMFLAQALQLDDPIADRLLEACVGSSTLATPSLAAAATLAVRLPIDRALIWSARIRSAGYAPACPLLAIARSGQSRTDRSRAAATAFAAFGDEEGRTLLREVWAFASAPQRALIKAEISQLCPELLPTLVDTPAADSLARTAEVRASIVIPCFNKAELTLQCLQSLAVNTDSHLYEVILVDNGSTDQTMALASVNSDRFRVIRNDKNLGFARACNQGAAAAKADVIVFLNNDTVAKPQWLEWLLTHLDSNPNVAVVGSRLLYPDGSIQHAGVELELDDAGLLRGIHVHAGKPGDHPEAMVPRTVPAVTGAVLAVRRQVFNRIGGFHEGYWNGNEDVDLCLSVREAGYEIAYEPRSILTHLESQSGPERYSGYAGNVALLNERWRSKVDSLAKQRQAVSLIAR